MRQHGAPLSSALPTLMCCFPTVYKKLFDVGLLPRLEVINTLHRSTGVVCARLEIIASRVTLNTDKHVVRVGHFLLAVAPGPL